MLTNWQCTILGPLNTPVENRIISLVVTCGPNYPNEAPTVTFQSKLNFPFVVRRHHPSAPEPSRPVRHLIAPPPA